MKLIERIRAARKAFWGGGDWVSSDLPGNISSSGNRRLTWIPGTRIDWETTVGDLWNCPAVQACLNWEWRNAPQAPPIVEEVQRDGTWEVQAGHPLIDLLNKPIQDGDWDWSTLLSALLVSLDCGGTSYQVIERTRGGQVGELVWLPYGKVDAPQERGGPWVYWGKTRTEIPQENMARIRFGIDPNDPRFGLAALASAHRGTYTLQQAVNYGANVLKNFGTIGMLVSGKTETVGFDPDLLAKQIKDKTTGDNVGGIVAIEAPVDVEYPGATPEKMALESLSDRPEADICALFGLPPQVVGVHVGRLSKTYANYAEAREAAWEEKVMPMLNLIGVQLGGRLLPEYADATTDAARQAYAKQFRLSFDYSSVRPLQPDLDKVHIRVREDYKAGLIDRYTALTETNRPAEDADKDVYYSAAGGGNAPPPDALVPLPKPNGNGAKPAKDWAERMAAELDLLHAGSA